MIKNKLKKLNQKMCFSFAVILSVSCLSACMTIGENFPNTVKGITENKTTVSEIEQTFGEPFRTGYDSGYYSYTYGYYKYSLFSNSLTKDLTVRFNKDKTVHNYSFFSSFPADKEFIKQEQSQ